VITTKSLPVGGVIKADDVRALATLVEKAMSSATDAPADPAYRFVLVGADGTRWSCDSDDVLGPAGPLTTDRIRALRLDACIKKEGEAPRTPSASTCRTAPGTTPTGRTS
jgi:hypothetical protein